MYHDVVELDRADGSGFRGHGPARYKLDPGDFERHLAAIAAIAATGRAPGSALELLAPQDRASVSRLFLTFDDGGASAAEIGASLARRGWIGHFFVTTDFIGKPGFLDVAAIAELARAGHVICTHSCSHPIPMSQLPDDVLMDEWRRSIGVLSDITGTAVVIGSVPGGYSSRRVVRAAAAAGLQVLFTSEPVTASQRVDGCLVLGRYAILAGTAPETAAALAAGKPLARLGQYVSWKTKGAAKAVLGDSYRRLRTAMLERS